MGQLEGRVALVTGGGRGIGRGIVRRFLKEGAKIAIVQRSEIDDNLARNPDIVLIQADLSDSTTLKSVVSFVADRFGKLDILVNNAGIMFSRTIEELEEKEWDLMLNVNLKAPVLMCKYAVPEMKKQGGGSSSNIGVHRRHRRQPCT